MAIYHCSVKTISRGQGRSAVGAAAYRAGEKLENERDGMTHDYTHKEGVEHTEIMTPENAPDWTKDRGTLWNEVEKSETRVNSRTAREVEVALPQELDRESQKELLRDYVKENFNDQGMIADVAIHDKGDGNPHAHILLTTREIDEDGKFGKKRRDWDKNEQVDKWRESWEKHANRYLEREGHEQRIDHRSYKDQGIEKLPQIHEGPTQRDMKAKGKELLYDKIELNREIKEQNRQLELIAKREPLLEKQKENLLEELKQLTTEQPKPYLTTVPEQRTPEPKKEPLSYSMESIKISDLAKEVRSYYSILLREETERTKRLEEIKHHKVAIAQPYRAEVIEKHIQDKWGTEWTKVQKEKRYITQKLRDHADGKDYGMFDRLSGAYKRDGEELRHQSRNIDFREKDLISVFDRTRQELINPRNIHAHGRYEVDRKADELAQVRDPQYQAKMKTLKRMEDMIINERQATTPERKLMSELARNLDKVKDKKQEISLPIGRDQEGRLSIEKAIRTPETGQTLINTLGKVNQSIERANKALEKSQGLTR